VTIEVVEERKEELERNGTRRTTVLSESTPRRKPHKLIQEVHALAIIWDSQAVRTFNLAPPEDELSR